MLEEMKKDFVMKKYSFKYYSDVFCTFFSNYDLFHEAGQKKIIVLFRFPDQPLPAPANWSTQYIFESLRKLTLVFNFEWAFFVISYVYFMFPCILHTIVLKFIFMLSAKEFQCKMLNKHHCIIQYF